MNYLYMAKKKICLFKVDRPLYHLSMAGNSPSLKELKQSCVRQLKLFKLAETKTRHFHVFGPKYIQDGRTKKTRSLRGRTKCWQLFSVRLKRFFSLPSARTLEKVRQTYY